MLPGLQLPSLAELACQLPHETSKIIFVHRQALGVSPVIVRGGAGHGGHQDEPIRISTADTGAAVVYM